MVRYGCWGDCWTWSLDNVRDGVANDAAADDGGVAGYVADAAAVVAADAAVAVPRHRMLWLLLPTDSPHRRWIFLDSYRSAAVPPPAHDGGRSFYPAGNARAP